MSEKPRRTPAEPVAAPLDGLETRPTNPYYGRVAGGYRAAKYLTLALLVITLIAGLLTGADSITYANLVYLLRDFDTILDTSGDATAQMRYTAADGRQYLRFREGLALVGDDGVEVFNAAGRRTLDDAPGFNMPRGAASTQYLLVWDMGGESFSIYNSLSAIYTDTLEYPITGGTISDAGLFAVVTRTREYPSAVLLYGKNCKLKNRYLKDKYVMDVAISDDGRRVAIASVESSGGAYRCEFQLCRPGEDSAITTVSLAGEFPYALRFFADNSCVLLGSTAIYFYSAEGEQTGVFRFGEQAPMRFAAGEKRAVLVFAGNVMGSACRVLLLDAHGEAVAERTFDGLAIDAALGGDAVWLLTENRLWRWDTAADDARALDYAGGGRALIGRETEAFVCTDRAAFRYTADDFR